METNITGGFHGTEEKWEPKLNDIKKVLDIFTEEELKYAEVSLLLEGHTKESFEIAKTLILDEFRGKITPQKLPNLLNKDFLLSEHFEKNLETLKKYPDNFDILLNIMSSKISIGSKYHISDIDIIAKCDNFDRAFYLLALAENKESLLSDYHTDDMNLLANAPSINEFPFALNELYNVLINKNSLESNYHREDTNKMHISLKQIEIIEKSNLEYEKKSFLLRKKEKKLILLSYHACDEKSLAFSGHNELMNAILDENDEKYELLTAKLENENSEDIENTQGYKQKKKIRSFFSKLKEV